MTYSLILPVLNENDNIEEILREIAALGIHGLEIIVADGGSTDGTPDHAERCGAGIPIRVLRSDSRRGLSESVVAAFDVAKGEILCCMDADGQHRPRDLADLLRTLEAHPQTRIAVGSRFAKGGGFEEEWNPFRFFCSRAAAFAARIMLRVRLLDPMSGFFCIRSETYRALRGALNPSGFKILLELVFLAGLKGWTEVLEHPIRFAMRKRGKSKFSCFVALQYAAMLFRLRFRAGKIRRLLRREEAADDSRRAKTAR